jgi:hypothetical protein
MRLFARSLVAAVVLTAVPAVAAERLAAERLAQLSTYSASGVHKCQSDTDSGHTCIVTRLYFSNCIDANSALRVQDCCPTTRVCARNAATGETKCQKGGKSIEFHMSYCIGGR